MSIPALKTVDIGGGQTIGYREAGDGAPLVFLHGLGGRSESWATQYERLSRGYRVIGWDAPGYGGSSPLAKDDPVIADYLDAAVRFADALRLERLHLVGHSVGSVIAAAFHRHHGDRLLSLTLAEAVAGNGRDPSDKRDAAIAARLRELDEMGAEGFARARTPNSLSPDADPKVIARAVEFASGMNVEGYKRLFRALVSADIFEEVVPLRVPGLIVAGADDRSAPPPVVKSIADAYPGIRHEVIPGIGHQIAVEHPDRFNAILEDFLAQAEAKAA